MKTKEYVVCDEFHPVSYYILISNAFLDSDGLIKYEFSVRETTDHYNFNDLDIFKLNNIVSNIIEKQIINDIKNGYFDE